ncbi:hypothetical protein EDB83DRAFT_2311552 [Lactarius deliciosus]|nr:hypothetical protein EDB83DRAFT_2311552 [Lactarius deliciosus]
MSCKLPGAYIMLRGANLFDRVQKTQGQEDESEYVQVEFEYLPSEQPKDLALSWLGFDEQVLQRLYNAWDPSARNCMQISDNHLKEGGYADQVETAVRDFVRKFQHTPIYIDTIRESHKGSPTKELGMILSTFIKAEVAEQIFTTA